MAVTDAPINPETITDAVELVNALKVTNTEPLWAQMTRLNPPAPNPRTVPHLWSYEQVRPYLLRAGALITEKQAERRVLMLINPAREAPFTTDTLYAGLQLVQPRETAPAHRHTAFACRFIIEGRGGFTAVHGQRIPMKPRDVIVTPTWNWHDHGKKGADEDGGDDQPVIWLDGLDLPNFVHFPVHFVEHYAAARYPAEEADDSPIVFHWDAMEARLAAQPGVWASQPYLKKDGREISRIIGASAEKLHAGNASPPVRETASSVYHIIQGTGHSTVGDTILTWKQGDTFAVPAWHRYQHFADSAGDVFLYRFDDKPMLNALGFYRVEGGDVEMLVSD
ncbi:gentisate-dioxygenase [Grosmannia clavigera kw1407]|uniref:Gentisate-dioxygenase n=1 Tax=Grosmannia clavigera (strain kw1407 / UAMH 11150) TaxID=655863 RepID=F0XIP6_GROCL|nr:gentisate-dioxygenase [Grosmannia clavigera kw1407]EFX02365.1 gentisate-dioxygenase [Grosmannia clavigera kw1407]